MRRRTYGILAGMIGSALGAWWYSRRRTGPGPPPHVLSNRNQMIPAQNTPELSPEAVCARLAPNPLSVD